MITADGEKMTNIYFFKFRGHKPLYSISVSNMFLSTSLPPTPNWDRFDQYVTVLFVLLMD
jgi:hypothetical protein